MGLLDWFRKKSGGGGGRDADKPSEGTCTGGDGLSFDTAVVVNASGSLTGVPAEYRWLARKHGGQGAAWNCESQALMEHGGRFYDQLNIKLSDGARLTYYFDISKFFGKL